jgi:hypothetical protein
VVVLARPSARSSRTVIRIRQAQDKAGTARSACR